MQKNQDLHHPAISDSYEQNDAIIPDGQGKMVIIICCWTPTIQSQPILDGFHQNQVSYHYLTDNFWVWSNITNILELSWRLILYNL